MVTRPMSRLCSGSCLPHCYQCSLVTVVLSKLSFVYLVASAVYIVQTRKLGTPFNDSLTEEQRSIKREAVEHRKRAFHVGLAVGCMAAVGLRFR